MNETTTVVLIVAIVAVLAIALIVAVSRRSSRLRPLPAESRDRFVRTWTEIESRFIDDPRSAVQEADRAAVMILSERGATIHDDGREVPDDLRDARQAASSDEGRQGTEGLRKAMVHYKRIVDDAVGTRGTRETSRREVA